MPEQPVTWNELKEYVHQALCQKENLIAEQFPLEVYPLLKRDQFCGMEFTLYGPRQIRLAAIWSADNNTIFFYDARGVRYRIERFYQPITGFPEVVAA